MQKVKLNTLRPNYALAGQAARLILYAPLRSGKMLQYGIL